MNSGPLAARVALCGLVVLTSAGRTGAAETPPATVALLGAPARGADCGPPALARGPDGTVWLAWIQHSEEAGDSVRLTRLEGTSSWAPDLPVSGLRAPSISRNSPPGLAVGPGGRVGLCWVAAGEACASTSEDGGLTWTEPRVLGAAAQAAAHPGLTALADGRFAAVWAGSSAAGNAGTVAVLFGPGLGGSTAPSPGSRALTASPPFPIQSVFAPGEGGTGEPGFASAIGAFPDGSAIAATRAPAAAQSGEIAIARLRKNVWAPFKNLLSAGSSGGLTGGASPAPIAASRTASAAEPSPASSDSASPLEPLPPELSGPLHGGSGLGPAGGGAGGSSDAVFAPSVAVDGGRVALAWVTGKGTSASVNASESPEAGDRFLSTLQVDEGGALPGTAVALLHDGAVLVFWYSNADADQPVRLWMRRITPDFTLNAPQLVGSLTGDPAGPPAVALIRDYAGGTDSARVAVAYAVHGRKSTVMHALSVTVPESALLAAADPGCHCAPSPAELVGYPIRGTIAAVAAADGSLNVEHDAFPGLLEEGTDRLRAAPQLIAMVKPGTRFLGRIERRGTEWWLFDVRLLGAPRS